MAIAVAMELKQAKVVDATITVGAAVKVASKKITFSSFFMVI